MGDAAGGGYLPPVVVQLIGDNEEALKDIAEVQAAMDAISDETATVKVDEEGAASTVDKIIAAIATARAAAEGGIKIPFGADPTGLAADLAEIAALSRGLTAPVEARMEWGAALSGVAAFQAALAAFPQTDIAITAEGAQAVLKAWQVREALEAIAHEPISFELRADASDLQFVLAAIGAASRAVFGGGAPPSWWTSEGGRGGGLGGAELMVPPPTELIEWQRQNRDLITTTSILDAEWHEVADAARDAAAGAETFAAASAVAADEARAAAAAELLAAAAAGAGGAGAGGGAAPGGGGFGWGGFFGNLLGAGTGDRMRFGGGRFGGGFGGLGMLGFGGLPVAPVGSALAFAGLGREHWLMTLLGLGGYAAGGVLGGGLAAAGALGPIAVGGGADMLVMKSTIADTQTLQKAMEKVREATLQYGAGSKQAAAATADLNLQMALLGNTAGVKAEAGLAAANMALNQFWDQQTSGARIAAVGILQQVDALGRAYVPLVASAAANNLGIINEGLRPLFAWLQGPQGIGIWTDLENKFKRDLPYAVNAFDEAVKFVLRSLDYLAGRSGNFARTLDELFTRANSPSGWASWTHIMDKLLVDFHLWEDVIKNLTIDLFLLFSNEQGTAQSIVGWLDQMLIKVGAWERSTAGAAGIKSIFQVHKEEILAILNLIEPLAIGFGKIYLAVAPAFTMALTDILKAILPVLTALASNPFGAWILGLTIIGLKLGLLGGPFGMLWKWLWTSELAFLGFSRTATLVTATVEGDMITLQVRTAAAMAGVDAAAATTSAGFIGKLGLMGTALSRLVLQAAVAVPVIINMMQLWPKQIADLQTGGWNKLSLDMERNLPGMPAPPSSSDRSAADIAAALGAMPHYQIGTGQAYGIGQYLTPQEQQVGAQGIPNAPGVTITAAASISNDEWNAWYQSIRGNMEESKLAMSADARHLLDSQVALEAFNMAWSTGVSDSAEMNAILGVFDEHAKDRLPLTQAHMNDVETLWSQGVTDLQGIIQGTGMMDRLQQSLGPGISSDMTAVATLWATGDRNMRDYTGMLQGLTKVAQQTGPLSEAEQWLFATEWHQGVTDTKTLMGIIKAEQAVAVTTGPLTQQQMQVFAGLWAKGVHDTGKLTNDILALQLVAGDMGPLTAGDLTTMESMLAKGVTNASQLELALLKLHGSGDFPITLADLEKAIQAGVNGLDAFEFWIWSIHGGRRPTNPSTNIPEGSVPHQTGGPVIPGIDYWVGEVGPELFRSQVPGYVYPSGSHPGGGGATTQVLNMPVNMEFNISGAAAATPQTTASAVQMIVRQELANLLQQLGGGARMPGRA